MPPIGGKKPFTQALPEPALEPIQGSAIVVIHPGSAYLRLGRAADTFPHSIPHCIARRHKQPKKQPRYEDTWLERETTNLAECNRLQNSGLAEAQELLQSRPLSSGHIRQCTTFTQVAEVNHGVRAQVSDVRSPHRWTDTSLKDNYFVGEEALYVRPDECYNLHWPIRCGKFNLHSSEGGTLTGILQDLETIWGSCISKYLDIPLRDLKHYRAVLLIPDIYNRRHVRELMNLLLTRLGFAAAFCVQESVCATFGAGVTSACVIDVGDQKLSISCVEDGFSAKRTRMSLDVGGRDITRCFYSLLIRCDFPYKDCQLGRRTDALFLQELKEKHCTLEQDAFGMTEQHLHLKQPQKNIIKYTVQMGDERILAALSPFFPGMLGVGHGTELCHSPEVYYSDPHDAHDEDYLTQTMSKHEQAARLVAIRKRENAEKVDQGSDAAMLEEVQLEDDDALDMGDGPAGSQEGIARVAKWRMDEDEEGMDFSDGLPGLDHAIIQCVERCESDEMKMRMYSCIVVVGGGMLIQGAQQLIQNTVWILMPAQFRLTLQTMDVITQPKELDPRLTCWKGGAVLSCLDTSQELWIRRKEWEKLGVRVLRERALFTW